jgi:predicted GIY-YIG superfamily endonuclease
MLQHKAALLHHETYPDKYLAAKREKEIKGWSHAKKVELIRKGM